MAGASGSLGGGERPKRGKTSHRKKKKRLGFRLDMTPLVDITFLLLTFFMFTTTMLKPHVMEMAIPPEIHEKIEVVESDLLTFRIVKQNLNGKDSVRVFWNIGIEKPVEVHLDSSSIRKLVEEQHYLKMNNINVVNNIDKINKVLAINKLITLLKIADNVPYEYVIKMLDFLNLTESLIITNMTNQIDNLLPQFSSGQILETKMSGKIVRKIDLDDEGNKIIIDLDQNGNKKKILRQRRFTIAPLLEEDYKEIEGL